tara:strand:- start:987 stop:1157 length:171 start_codon:yes stop_codon:yes gene_type:complete
MINGYGHSQPAFLSAANALSALKPNQPTTWMSLTSPIMNYGVLLIHHKIMLILEES